MYFTHIDDEAGAQGENDNSSIHSANVGQYKLCTCQAKIKDYNVTGSSFQMTSGDVGNFLLWLDNYIFILCVVQ